MQRPDWLNLNGVWEFEAAGCALGKDHGWLVMGSLAGCPGSSSTGCHHGLGSPTGLSLACRAYEQAWQCVRSLSGLKRPGLIAHVWVMERALHAPMLLERPAGASTEVCTPFHFAWHTASGKSPSWHPHQGPASLAHAQVQGRYMHAR